MEVPDIEACQGAEWSVGFVGTAKCGLLWGLGIANFSQQSQEGIQ